MLVGVPRNGPRACVGSAGPVRTIAPMQAFHSDRHLLPLPPGHRFPRSKYRLLRERVAGLAGPRRRARREPVGDADLALASTTRRMSLR